MATKKNQAAKTPVTAADAIAGHLLSQFKDELNTIQNPSNPKQSVWGTQSEIQQREILDRLKRRIRHSLDVGFTELFAEGVPAVVATVASINFKKKGIVCTLEVHENAEHRHELADSAQSQVLVVITPDVDGYMQSAELIKADSNQAELGLDNAGDDVVPDDPRNKDELIKVARELALKLDEPDVAESAESRTQAQLLDYIQWAEKKLHDQDQAVKH